MRGGHLPKVQRRESGFKQASGTEQRCLQDKLQETEALVKQYGVAADSELHKSQVLLTHIDTALTIGALLHKLDGSEQLTELSFKAEHRMFQQYTTKVKKAVGRQELSNQRKKTEVNVDAMHRFIEHAVPDLDHEQKQQLKQVRSACQDMLPRAALTLLHAPCQEMDALCSGVYRGMCALTGCSGG